MNLSGPIQKCKTIDLSENKPWTQVQGFEFIYGQV